MLIDSVRKRPGERILIVSDGEVRQRLFEKPYNYAKMSCFMMIDFYFVAFVII